MRFRESNIVSNCIDRAIQDAVVLGINRYWKYRDDPRPPVVDSNEFQNHLAETIYCEVIEALHGILIFSDPEGDDDDPPPVALTPPVSPDDDPADLPGAAHDPADPDDPQLFSALEGGHVMPDNDVWG